MPISLGENIVVLYVIHIFNYVVPLLLIPWLTRHLGLVGWGEFALAEALARYLTLFIEYGFTLSGTREVARYQDSPEHRSSLLAGILAAQCVLAGGSVLIALIASRVFPGFREFPLLFWSAIAWGILDAFNLMWYFQGIERTRLVGAFDIGSRAVGVILIFIFVQTADDGWKAFLFRALASGLSFALCLRTAYREISAQRPDFAGATRMLREGLSMFLLRSSINLYLLSNVLILGLFVPPQIVGLYSGAEKLSRAAIAMLNPITQAIYPRISKLVHTGTRGSAGLVRMSMALMGAGSTITALFIFAFAPVIVRVLLGKDFTDAMVILRVLCLLHPIVALNNVLGLQWLIPHGLDRKFNLITIAGGVINIVLGLILAPRLMQFGTVWSTIFAELVMFLSIALVCVRLNINPLRSERAEMVNSIS